MILVTHVFIALFSVAYTTYLFFVPSRFKLRVSHSLAAATIISGTFLVVSRGTHILESCAVGLLYVGAVSVATISVQRRLAVYRVENDKSST